MVGVGCGCGEDHITGVVCVYVGVSWLMVMVDGGMCVRVCLFLKEGYLQAV